MNILLDVALLMNFILIAVYYWRSGVGRLGRFLIGASAVWVITWVVFFTYLASFERPTPIAYLTFASIVLGPPGVLGLIGWVERAFAQRGKKLKAWQISIGAMLGGYALSAWFPLQIGHSAIAKYDMMVPYAERSEGLSFSRSMVCRGTAVTSVGGLRAEKKVSVTASGNQDADVMAVKITDTGVIILTQAAVSIGVTESSPMPIVRDDASLIFAVDVNKGWDASADVFSLNKETGVAIYGTIRSMGGTGAIDGSGMAEFMECR